MRQLAWKRQLSVQSIEASLVRGQFSCPTTPRFY